MVEESTVANEEPKEVRPAFAVIMELDGVVVDTRSIIYELIAKEVASCGGELTPATFSRYVLSATTLSDGLDQLTSGLELNNFNPTKLADTIQSELESRIAYADLRPGVLETVAKAKEKKGQVIIASNLPEKLTQKVLEKLGDHHNDVTLVQYSKKAEFPRADAYLKICREYNLPVHICLALVSTHRANRAALTIGIRCIAVPDEYTLYQDFSGAYVHLDQLTDIDFDQVTADWK